MYSKKFEEFENKFNETKNEFRREIDSITSEFKKQTEEFVNTIKELRESKSQSFNFESDIMLGIRNSVKEATMKTLIDHCGPLSGLIKEEVLNYKDEFQDVFNNALNECFSSEEFYSELKQQVMKKIAQELVSSCQSVVSKSVEQLKQNAAFKAQMILLIEKTINENKEKKND